jgi:hypothetical protein
MCLGLGTITLSVLRLRAGEGIGFSLDISFSHGDVFFFLLSVWQLMKRLGSKSKRTQRNTESKSIGLDTIKERERDWLTRMT